MWSLRKLGSYGPKKGEGRCFSALAKFTVIGKFLVRWWGHWRKRKAAAGWKEGEGRRDKVQLQGFKQLLCLSSKFPSITNGGEDSRNKKKQAERRRLTLTAWNYILWPEAHYLPLWREGEGKVAGSGWRVAGSSDEDQRQGEWQHWVLLGSSNTISCNTSPSSMHSMQVVAAYQGGRF